MITIQLEEEIEKRLNNLSTKTGRSKTDYIREAILEYLEEIEDRDLAIERLDNPSKRWTMEEVEKDLGLEN
ncbi:MAG: ribbon-helix-helix protein, CopG family [Candidatus Omnitrophota bacterium]|nr:MAG: ribbon-helix-helix protein, CopG family [Candidatus Omnitrophota bacterium]